MNPNIIFMDLETGGLDPEKHAVLEVGFYTEVEGRPRHYQKLVRWPGITVGQDGNVTPEALRINRLTPTRLLQEGVGCHRVASELKQFLLDVNVESGRIGDTPIQFGGHNVGSFDYPFLKRLYGVAGHRLPPHHHRFVDTASILRFLNDAGKIDAANSFEEAVRKLVPDEPYGTDEWAPHRALGDARAAYRLYHACLNLIRSPQPTVKPSKFEGFSLSRGK